MLGTRNRGGRIICVDEHTELWRHPKHNFFHLIENSLSQNIIISGHWAYQWSSYRTNLLIDDWRRLMTRAAGRQTSVMQNRRQMKIDLKITSGERKNHRSNDVWYVPSYQAMSTTSNVYKYKMLLWWRMIWQTSLFH